MKKMICVFLCHFSFAYTMDAVPEAAQTPKPYKPMDNKQFVSELIDVARSKLPLTLALNNARWIAAVHIANLIQTDQINGYRAPDDCPFFFPEIITKQKDEKFILLKKTIEHSSIFEMRYSKLLGGINALYPPCAYQTNYTIFQEWYDSLEYRLSRQKMKALFNASEVFRFQYIHPLIIPIACGKLCLEECRLRHAFAFSIKHLELNLNHKTLEYYPILKLQLKPSPSSSRENSPGRPHDKSPGRSISESTLSVYTALKRHADDDDDEKKHGTRDRSNSFSK